MKYLGRYIVKQLFIEKYFYSRTLNDFSNKIQFVILCQQEGNDKIQYFIKKKI